MTEVVCPKCHVASDIDLGGHPELVHCSHCGADLFPGAPIFVDEHSFPKHIAGNELPVIVDFWAEWCGPCKALDPYYKQAAEKLRFKVRFLKVDTDEEQKLAGHNGVRGFPTLLIYDQGLEVARRAGAMTLSALLNWIDEEAGE